MCLEIITTYLVVVVCLKTNKQKNQLVNAEAKKQKPKSPNPTATVASLSFLLKNITFASC